MWSWELLSSTVMVTILRGVDHADLDVLAVTIIEARCHARPRHAGAATAGSAAGDLVLAGGPWADG
jgi:hypothetical protein